MARRSLSSLIVLASLVLVPGGPALAQAAGGDVAADVLSRTVQRGEMLSAHDFVSKVLPGAQARGAVRADAADGLEARRTLRSGMPVRASDLAEPRLVKRGEPVTIVLQTGALSITAAGRALADGALGEPVRVFSEATNQTLNGVVEDTGRVRVAAR